jgi:hypothetical protein
MNALYDLNNIYFIQYDIDHILKIIDDLYNLDLIEGKLHFYPKTFIAKDHHWASDSSKEAFNTLIPIAKSLIQNMYSVLESVLKGKIGRFDKLKLENEFKNLKELRLLNNKFKHYNNKDVEINLTQIVFIKSTKNTIDIFINYKYNGKLKIIGFSELIEVFLIILAKKNIITIKKNIVRKIEISFP